jgi:2-polyprenyl-3-methyl-5-hydroxy-6-metoxy-1,4-benzoquinol methylase
MPLTRWEQFYLDDERVMSTPASHCVRKAVDEFSRCDAQLILDVACGVGRDSFYLGENGFRVIGVDAAESGLMIANS